MNTEYTVAYDGWDGGGCISVCLENVLKNGVRHQGRRYLGDYRDPLLPPSLEGSVQAAHRRVFVPQFRFTLESLPARVDVRVWPLLALRGISLRVNGVILYAEGCFSGSPDASESGDLWDWELDR